MEYREIKALKSMVELWEISHNLKNIQDTTILTRFYMGYHRARTSSTMFKNNQKCRIFNFLSGHLNNNLLFIFFFIWIMLHFQFILIIYENFSFSIQVLLYCIVGYIYHLYFKWIIQYTISCELVFTVARCFWRNDWFDSWKFTRSYHVCGQQ